MVYTVSTVVYNRRVQSGYLVRLLPAFDTWLRGLRDAQGRARILARIKRAEQGHLGDSKSVGHEVSEMRIDCGPGYRLYYTRRGRVLIVLLCGGDKSTQRANIKRARTLAAACTWKE